MLILSYSLRNMFKFLNSIKTPSALFILFSLILFPITSAFAQTTLSPTLLVRGLERGLYGEDVQELQKFLNVSGFVVSSDGPGSPGNETTFFGDLTLEALTRFQEANPDTYRSVGLDKPSGYFGPATMTKVVEVAETIPDVKIVPPSPQVFEKVVSYKPYVGREVEPENTIFEPFKKIAKTIIQSQLTVPVSTVTPISTLIPVNTPAPVITTTVTSTSGAGSNSSPSSSAPIVYAEDLTDISVSGSPSNFSFSGSTYTYNNITVINDVESITITPTGSGTITVDGTEVTSGEASGAISLTEAVEKTISVVVAEEGKTSRTYTIKITRSLRVAETPTFSPTAGAITYGSTVTISSTGADAIYYTTDGSTPTVSSTNQADTPLVINSAVTVKALAVKAGYTNSDIGIATYTQTVSDDLTDLVISGSPSNYSFSASTYTYSGITISNTVSSITITPTGSGTITVDGVEVVSGEASGSIALTEGVEKTISIVVTETGKSLKTYTLNITRNSGVTVTPTFSPVAGAVTFGTTVTIASSGADAIYYTTDGSTPTTSSTNQAVTPLVINSAVTVKALAVKATYDDSSVASATYTQSETADLTGLALSGSPSNYTFVGSTYTYNSVALLNAVSSVTVTPTGSGTITVDGVEVVSGEASGSIALTEGVEKTITVVATETGKSAKTYTINVTRAVASPTGLTASAVSTSAIDISWTNTDETAQTRVYRGGSLVTTVNAAVTTYSDTGLSGGTEYTYTVRHYKNSVESVDSTSDSATTSLAVEYLVVAGGGGGRSGFIDGQPGGGGGAASLVTAATFQPGITYTIVVGAGGAGGASGSASGANGGESSLHNGTSYLARMAGGTGGSGTTGGAGGTVLSGSGAAGGVGGNQNTSPGSIGSGTGGGGGGGYGGTGGGNGGAGGGGGAGGVGGTSPGTAGVSSSGSGGQPGWDGANASGGGGGGGGYNISGKCNSTSGCYGGGGGGGGGASQGNPAGNGGEGVVIIRYLGSQKATGGTITSSGGYTIHTFTSSGTFSF